MALLLQYTIIYATVLLLVALGGCFSERSGIINLGLEGIMVAGALGGALVMKYMPNLSSGAMVVSVILGSVIFGMVFSLLLAVAAINFNADQTLVGTAMNMLATAAATVLVKGINMAENPNNVASTIQYIDQKKAFSIVKIAGFEVNWFMIITIVLLIAANVVLYHTKLGLRLMACGEHPQAADSVGINVYKMRYIGVLISGFLGGLGGIVYITAGVSEWKFENGVAGFGFLALAVMIFGQWKPNLIALAAVIFGLFRALSNVYSGFDFLVALNIPGTFYKMLPYIISLLVLAVSSKKSRAPKAEGIPYDKGQR